MIAATEHAPDLPGLARGASRHRCDSVDRLHVSVALCPIRDAAHDLTYQQTPSGLGSYHFQVWSTPYGVEQLRDLDSDLIASDRWVVQKTPERKTPARLDSACNSELIRIALFLVLIAPSAHSLVFVFGKGVKISARISSINQSINQSYSRNPTKSAPYGCTPSSPSWFPITTVFSPSLHPSTNTPKVALPHQPRPGPKSSLCFPERGNSILVGGPPLTEMVRFRELEPMVHEVEKAMSLLM